MSWHEAQNFCNSISCPNSEEPNSAHLVEIFNQEQQDFMVMKAFEAESFTLSEREWWIGMTDDNSEGIFLTYENLSKINGEYKDNELVSEVIRFIEKDKKRPICSPQN